MPELPDIELYRACLKPRILGTSLSGFRLASIFFLRTVEPPPACLVGRQVMGLSRLGKRLVLEFEEDFFAVLHLMIAGRLLWKKPGAPIPARLGLAAFDFPNGSLMVTEAGTRKRAALHLVRTRNDLMRHDPGGLEVLEGDLEAFTAALRRENHTLKRALTDPRLFAGIGNAYSDEILHRARLSPLRLTRNLQEPDLSRLFQAARETLILWRDRLIAETGDKWPEKVTAFREGMAVHGRFRQPCPVCGSTIQRIVRAENEANYCPGCQTGGRLLADPALSRLLREDWPRTQDELERLFER